MKNISPLVLLCFAFFLFNFLIKNIAISSTPPSQTYDEIIYATEAQSIVTYGTDLTGTWRPWNLEPSDPYYTELTSTMLTPGFLLFPHNFLYASKFMPLLLGSLIPIFLGLIAYKFTESYKTFIITAFIATGNPWVFQFSRMGYDSLFSVALYLMGVVLLFFCKKWWRLLSILPFFLGFFQYQGHKLILVPLLSIVCLYLFFEKDTANSLKHRYWKVIRDVRVLAALCVLFFSIMLTLSYIVRLPNLNSEKRASEFSLFNGTGLARNVDEKRRIAFDTPLKNIFSNKYSELSSTLMGRFLNSFNTQRLFIEGNRTTDVFTVLDYGFFHIIDVVVLGVASVCAIKYAKNKNGLLFVCLFILIGTIPNVLRNGDSWITFRGAFVFLGLILLMGIGTTIFFDRISRKYYLVVSLFYVLTVTPFFYTYFFRYPITHGLYVGIYERVVASYIHRVGYKTHFLILPDRSDATFLYQIAYNSLITIENKTAINYAAQNKKYKIASITIEGNCPEDVSSVSKNDIIFEYISNRACVKNSGNSRVIQIKSLIDSGTIFTVYNDALCNQYQLSTYPQIRTNILEVEKLSTQEFCQSFFSLP